jgi:antitoxin component YwqK of YwqJK toxin-antitoxin module
MIKYIKTLPNYIIMLGLLIIFATSCKTKTNLDELFYDNNSNMTYTSDGKPFSGIAIKETSDRKFIMEFKNGKHHGSFITYDNNNIKVTEAVYSEGHRLSEDKWYDPQGNRVSYEEFIEKKYSNR